MTRRLSSSSAGIPLGRGLATSAPRGRVLATFDFTAAAASGGIFTAPPSWLSIACATTGRTVQTSASTLVTGIGANAWRARNAGSGLGLSVERAASNILADGDGATYGLLNVTRTPVTGPNGATSAYTWVTTVAGDGICFFITSTTTTAGQPYNDNLWVAHDHYVSGGAAAKWQHNHNWATSNEQILYANRAWSRLDFAGTSTAASSNNLVEPVFDNNASASVGTLDAGFFMLEGGKFPTSWIAGGATRAADKLSTTETIAPLGRLNMAMTVAPNFTTAEQGADAQLLWWSANNEVFLRQSDAKVCVKVGGSVVLASSALTWSREQALTVSCHLTAGGALSLTVSGATSGNGTSTASGVAAFTTTSTAYLLSTSSGAGECIDLRSVEFRTP